MGADPLHFAGGHPLETPIPRHNQRGSTSHRPRIRNDAVHAASQQAHFVLGLARTEVDWILADVRTQAAELTKRAEKQVRDLHKGGARTLHSGAPDRMLQIGQ